MTEDRLGTSEGVEDLGVLKRVEATLLPRCALDLSEEARAELVSVGGVGRVAIEYRLRTREDVEREAAERAAQEGLSDADRQE